jgi:hypothetical protein
MYADFPFLLVESNRFILRSSHLLPLSSTPLGSHSPSNNGPLSAHHCEARTTKGQDWVADLSLGCSESIFKVCVSRYKVCTTRFKVCTWTHQREQQINDRLSMYSTDMFIAILTRSAQLFFGGHQVCYRPFVTIIIARRELSSISKTHLITRGAVLGAVLRCRVHSTECPSVTGPLP